MKFYVRLEKECQECINRSVFNEKNTSVEILMELIENNDGTIKSMALYSLTEILLEGNIEIV